MVVRAWRTLARDTDLAVRFGPSRVPAGGGDAVAGAERLLMAWPASKCTHIAREGQGRLPTVPTVPALPAAGRARRLRCNAVRDVHQAPHWPLPGGVDRHPRRRRCRRRGPGGAARLSGQPGQHGRRAAARGATVPRRRPWRFPLVTAPTNLTAPDSPGAEAFYEACGAAGVRPISSSGYWGWDPERRFWDQVAEIREWAGPPFRSGRAATG